LANDSSLPDGTQSLSVVSATQGSAGGAVSVPADGSGIDYAPPAGFVGTDTFTYTLQDDDALTRQASVTVNVSQSLLSSLSGFVYIVPTEKVQWGKGVPGGFALSGQSTSDPVSLSVLTDDDGLSI
jgi:hypothetical protein